MRSLFFSYLFISPFLLGAQDKVVKYYDDSWSACSQEKSTYYGEFVKDGDHYNCIFYWTRSNILSGKAMYPDTLLSKPIGWQLSYYKNGRTEDSAYFDHDGKMTNSYHYYPNKQLEVHYFIPENQPNYVTGAFDETGKKIKNYIYAKEAEFKGGDKAWQSYLVKNVGKDFRNTKDDKELTVTVKVMFIIDESGYTSKAKVIESSGLSYVDKDAVRLILSSPQWNNAIHLNKPVKVYRLQPFTYVLTAAKK